MTLPIGTYFKYRNWNVTLYCKVLTEESFAYVAWSDPPTDQGMQLYKYVTTADKLHASNPQLLSENELFELQLVIATGEEAI
jgi:hypothetical protein